MENARGKCWKITYTHKKKPKKNKQKIENNNNKKMTTKQTKNKTEIYKSIKFV